MPKTIHQGRNVKRFREMLGIKQEALALDLGDAWNQKKISMLEQKEEIDAELLQQIADVLKVPTEAIRNFDEDAAMMNIQHNYDGSNNQGANNQGPNNGGTCYFTFNPLEKWLEALSENKRLYEALLKSEKEKNALLQDMINAMKG
ncbi:MAG TPA: helix-turn-helix transcriptional regulator, partial [Chitinophagaceae bacterium]|nr:helix-turn-helix transcriptional regulator [Chitinophagaceae bacterium]